jgi:hypothetical protein
MNPVNLDQLFESKTKFNKEFSEIRASSGRIQHKKDIKLEDIKQAMNDINKQE